MLTYPNIDPIALELFGFGIRWYSLAYMAGILLGWLLIARENKHHPIPNLTKKALDDVMVWAVLGIIIGGRLGHVLFYYPDYYLQNPLEIFYIWEGGMAFHGGLLGVIIAFYTFCIKYNIPFLRLMDIIAVASPIGLFFGRIANFINGELWGKVTTSQFGMLFPNAGPQPRHPSQLYEAALEGIALFIILYIVLRLTNARQKPGLLAGLFLIGYSLSRITAETFREPDWAWMSISSGQWLSIPMLLIGLYLIIRRLRGAH